MSDIAIHILLDEGQRERVTVPSEMKASDFLKELLEGLNLRTANGNGNQLDWKLTDKITGRVLEPEQTMHENGVHGGQELILHAAEAKPASVPTYCKHCGFANEPTDAFCLKCGKALGRQQVLRDLRIRVHGEDKRIQEVEVPSSFSTQDLIAELVGSVAKEHDWILYDKDTGNDLELSKSLAENGVRNGHELYLRIIPVRPQSTKKPGDGVLPPRPIPILTIAIIVATIVVIAGGGTLLYRSLSGRVAISPATADLKISEHQQFTAKVGGSAGSVRWSIDPPLGTIDSDGGYTAPRSVATQTTITVTATSVANPKKSGTTQITLEPGRAVVEVSPETAALTAGESAKFTANLSGTGNQGVRWSLKPKVGSIGPDGQYTAPAPVPQDMTVNVTATSVTDGDMSGSANVTLKPVTIVLTPRSVNILASTSARFEVTLGGTPNHGIRWTVSGPGYVSKNGVYFAPAVLSGDTTATVTATSSADPAKSASAVVRVKPVVAVSVSPQTGMLTAGNREQFSATITGTTNPAVRWTLTGPGSISPEGLYIAPAYVGTEESARVTATSEVDPNKHASASITLRPVTVTVAPASAEVWASQARRFSVLVLGSNNAGVRWTLSGRGSINQDGVYTAPSMIMSDQSARVTATSIADPTRSASATLTLRRYTGPMSGTITWTGSLPKNGAVTIDDAGASQGSVVGNKLPGLPVSIRLDNNKDYGISQPPGPSNGWKRLTFTSRRGKGNSVRITWTVVFEGGTQ